MPAEVSGAGKIGVLLVNLGSPDAPTPRAVRRYLDEFLSDRRVVEIPPLLWQPILKGVILNSRPRKSAANYRLTWDEEAGDSPLRVITRAQATALQARLGPDVTVDFAMRYGNPSIAERVGALMDAGCDRLLFAPLYPQYCAATTGTALDEVFRVLAGRRAMPALRTLPPYHDHPAYIAALAASVRQSLARLAWEPEAILVSFHGMPARTRELGDPYYAQCVETTRLLREALGHDAAFMPLAFQSRFGRARWLEPYALPTLAEMGGRGVRRVAVVMPGFAADCLETLEEIALQGRDVFEAAGGEEYAALPCLNASGESVEMLERIIGEQLEGWKTLR